MRHTSLVTIAALLLASCGGGGGGGTPTPTPTPAPAPAPGPSGTNFYTPPTLQSLTQADVQQIIAQAAAEARAQNLPSTIAVTDRVGNVLAIFEMTGADTRLKIVDPPKGGPRTDFHLLPQLPEGAARAGAVAKAVTGAYLSSSGNAFSTRTASQIVQEHFPPSRAAVGLESGPLFGVQFSSLPCSDLVARFNPAGGSSFVTQAGAVAQSPAMIGPKRTPLGLSADPGGIPLYKNGVVVGGLGVMGDNDYGADFEIQDVDRDREEIIALAGATGFDAPVGIRAERITVDGTTLRYADATTAHYLSNPSAAPSFATINGAQGRLVDLGGYYVAANGVLAGTAYGSEASGFREPRAGEFGNADAYILTDGAGNARFPARAGTDGARVAQPLTQAEVTAVLEEGFMVLGRARAQIRQPLDSRMEATISVVDSNGAILGIVRSPDAPVFGTDVSLQKARTAAFFSNPRAGELLSATPPSVVPTNFTGSTASLSISEFVGAANTFFGSNAVLTGGFGISARAFGNVARPFFPDGEVGRPHGPFSRPIESFSPFATGLQAALILPNVVQNVLFALGASPTDTAQRCTNVPDVAPGLNPLQNGIQIFPGSVPIYRGDVLVGAIGLSGDGIDQDDMISFLGLANGGRRVGTIGHRDPEKRSDRIIVQIGDGVRLRYVNCPFAPFVGSSDQNVCQGI